MDFINQFFYINWWKDSFILEGLGIFLTNYFLRDINSNNNIKNENDFLKESNEIKNINLIFHNLKNRAIKLDNSMDSHKIDFEIKNSEEAFNLFDELCPFKTSAIFEYLDSINTKTFFDYFLKENFDNKRIVYRNNSRIINSFDRDLFFARMDAINNFSIRSKKINDLKLDENEPNNQYRTDDLKFSFSEFFLKNVNSKGIQKLKIVRKNKSLIHYLGNKSNK